jgi:4-hydroxy-tetrahydrodipicolinate synthase
LFAWFSQVIRRAVPTDGALLGYHIPSLSGVPLSLDLLANLKDAFPRQFAGLKDSSVDAEHARALGQRFGTDLLVFSGTDSLFSLALEQGAAGCITALANLRSPDLRKVWDAFAGRNDPTADGLAPRSDGSYLNPWVKR